MPLITRTAIINIFLLLSAIPAQYLLSQWYGVSLLEYFTLPERINQFWSRVCESRLSLDTWKESFKTVLSIASPSYNGQDEPKPENHKDNEDIHPYFAESKHIRSPKPETVQFSVGEVIVHRRYGYSGVIIGWDLEATAPEQWLKKKYPPDRQEVQKTPHYRILINRANKFGMTTSYIPEEEITIIRGLQVQHPELKDYFIRYDGAKYVMKEWLKLKYPHD